MAKVNLIDYLARPITWSPLPRCSTKENQRNDEQAKPLRLLDEFLGWFVDFQGVPDTPNGNPEASHKCDIVVASLVNAKPEHAGEGRQGLSP